ncbi:MAG: YdcH family protein [Pseudomonadota bacterium]
MHHARPIVYSQGRLESLKARHAALDSQIQEEEKHNVINEIQLRSLKRLKLIIKEEMEGISQFH